MHTQLPGDSCKAQPIINNNNNNKKKRQIKEKESCDGINYTADGDSLTRQAV